MTSSILTQHGIRDAETVVEAALRTGVPLFIAAAIIEKESGGLNVYGNDRGGVFSQADPERPNPNVVTETNYRRFESRVFSGETSNGVGPAQITWPGFIRDARDRGMRLWVPMDNMVYGFELVAGYLNGSTTDAAIRNAGTRYNGAAAYGDDLLIRARAWETRLENTSMTLLTFPSASNMGTAAFWTRLEAVYRQMGYDVYCAPSYVQRGFCAPGKHPHGPNSRHFAARALDVGFDPPSGAPESDYEKSFLDVTVRMMEARYPQMFMVWNRGPGDHRDHAHFDDQRYPREGRYTNIALPKGNIGFGATGASVVALQRALNKTGARLQTDGIFGLRTFDALRAFQYDNRLTPDGIAGPATNAAFPKEAPVVKSITERVAPFRVSGPDAYATAAALRKFTPPSGRGLLLAARGTPDHVQAGVLAGRNPNIEVLPTRPGGPLPDVIVQEIKDIKPAWIRVAGGDTAVPSTAVAAAFTAAGITLP